MRKLNQSGYTLVELLIAVGIIAALTSSVLLARSFMAKQVVRSSEKAYATQKAIQMFEELRSLVNGNEKLGVSVLDDYSDGSLFNTVLTTDKSIDTNPPASGNAGDPLSGNRKINGHWTYLRQIQVNRLANDSNARQVIVKVWRYASDQNPLQPGELLSTVGGMLRTIQSLYPPTQVMDLYVIDVNTIQAWWDVLPTLSSGMQSVIGDIQLRNPGLKLRTHYITRSSFGRDSQYIPYINQAVDTATAPMIWAYFYPGNTPEDSGLCNTDNCPFFDPSNGGVLQSGTFNVDGSIVTASTNNPTNPGNATPLFTGCPSFAVADQSNHAMRYPDELSLYQAVTTAWANCGISPAPAMPEISERMLIDGMDSSPASFVNAMIINLHGELLPLPALRNYSDAAKDPASWATKAGQPTNNTPIYNSPNTGFNDQYVRVVTHPELLYYPTSGASVTVNLRVYAYYDGFQDTTTLAALANQQVPAISLFLPDYNNLSTANVVGVTYISGGAGVAYQYRNLTLSGGTYNNASCSATFKLANVGPVNQTLITLYNTDTRCPTGTGNTGLNPADDLYGLEYIPCSPNVTAALGGIPAGFSTFTTHDLTWNPGAAGGGYPKNTARWLISLSLPVTSIFNAGNVPVMNQVYAAPVTFPTILGQAGSNAHVIETRLGDGVTTSSVVLSAGGGTTINIPSNLSRTYLWLGNSFRPPLTEQYQMVGDPRHCPYLDIKVGGPGVAGAGATIGPNSFNWYFKNLPSPTDGYSGWGQTSGGWANGDEVDIPKYDMIIRQGLMKTTSIWTTLNGWSFYYYGLGGEFGFDHPPYSNSIQIQQAPYITTAAGENTVVTVNELVNWAATNYLNERLVAQANGGLGKDAWYSRYWMGELYPDSQYGNWVTFGNIPTVANAIAGEKFFREDYGNITSANSLNGFRSSFIRLQGPNGCSSFFLGSDTTTNDWFDHEGAGATGNVYSLAQSCYGVFTYQLPSVVSVQRPWNMHGDGNTPPESSSAPYSNILTTLSIPSIGGTSRLFYNSDQGSPWHGSGAVQVDNVPAGSASSPSQRAYVYETGTSPSANVGTQDLVETALVATLRTYLDGGKMYSPGNLGHISQVPLVELWSNVVPQFANPSTIPIVIDGAVTTGTSLAYSGFVTILAGPTTNVWYRYPGTTSNTGNFYTEEYPGYGGGVTASTYNESAVSLVYNLKYSYDNGKNWYPMQNPGLPNGSNSVTMGQIDLSDPVTGNLPITYGFNVSNTAYFPQGDYLLMVEAFRYNSSTGVYIPLHYAYHWLDVTIDR